MTTTDAWRYVYASVQGTSHVSLGTPCQDASRIREFRDRLNQSVLVLAGSDGAGSAAFAHVGSQIACDSIIGVVHSYLAAGGLVTDITEEMAREWVTRVADKLHVQAGAADEPVRAFACTLVAAVLAPEHSACLQIGDGALVVANGAGYEPVFWPQSGEYANTTFFLTDDSAVEHLQYTSRLGRVEEIAVFTDGLQMLALHYATRSAHPPFFHPLFHRLRLEPEGERDLLAHGLEEFLGSPPVNARTNDDKTLLLASRRTVRALMPPASEHAIAPGI